jgi:hypothetical protein
MLPASQIGIRIRCAQWLLPPMRGAPATPCRAFRGESPQKLRALTLPALVNVIFATSSFPCARLFSVVILHSHSGC